MATINALNVYNLGVDKWESFRKALIDDQLSVSDWVKQEIDRYLADRPRKRPSNT